VLEIIRDSTIEAEAWAAEGSSVSILVITWGKDVSVRVFQCRKHGSNSVFVTQAG
jgi:hypothetical protein